MQMRVVPTKAHAAVDQLVGPTLMLAPELLHLKADRTEALIPRVNGAAATVYTNLTDYELSMKRVLPVRVHLALDAMSGVMLAAAPWVTGSARRGRRHWLPHAVFGAFEVGLALTTKTEPGDRRKVDARARKAWKVALAPKTWHAVAQAGRTAAPGLLKARRQLAKAA
jgi:hypothetical protein